MAKKFNIVDSLKSLDGLGTAFDDIKALRKENSDVKFIFYLIISSKN